MVAKVLQIVLSLILICLIGCARVEGNLEVTISAQSTQIALLERDNNRTPSTETSTPSLPEPSPTSTALQMTATATPLPPTATPATSYSAIVRELKIFESDPDVCQNNEWRIVATDVQSFPGRNGFKGIVVYFAVRNDSPYWGKLNLDATKPAYIITEGGFQYQSIGTFTVRENDTQIQLRSRTPGRFGVMIPPGFAMQGDGEPFRWIFEVAESQNQFILSTPIIPICIHSNGTEYAYSNFGNETRAELDLSTEVSKIIYPTTADIPIVTEPIEIPGKGTLHYDGLEYGEGDELIVRMTFTNASEGYETTGYVKGYLIGDKGMLHQDRGGFGGSYRAGPGQTDDVYFSFEDVSPDENNLKLILMAVNHAGARNLPELWWVVDLYKEE